MQFSQRSRNSLKFSQILLESSHQKTFCKIICKEEKLKGVFHENIVTKSAERLNVAQFSMEV